MSQHDYNIANQGFPNFRSDLNNALGAIATNNSGSTAPTTTFAHQWWLDTSTTPNTLRIRNADNDAWVVVGTVNQTDDTFVFTPAAGSASAPAYSVTGDTNTGIFFPAADTIAFAEGGAEAMRIDSSGNVGIGTSSPTGAGKILHLNNSGTDGADVVDLRFTTGTTGATSVDGVRVRLSNAGDLDINNLEAKAVLISTQNTERMRIDSSGNVGIGTSSPTDGDGYGRALDIRSATGAAIYLRDSDDTTNDTLVIGRDSANSYIDSKSGNLIIYNAGSERARITSGGYFKATSTGSYYASTGSFHEFTANGSLQWGLVVQHTNNDNERGLLIAYTNDPNQTSNYYLYCDGGGTARAYIRGNGGFSNYQANDTNLCDEREKKNIESLSSTWDCLKHWEIKQFHYIQDDDTSDKKVGVIAQQVQEHCPEVIKDWVKTEAKSEVLWQEGDELPDGVSVGDIKTPATEEVTRLGVAEQQMYWMAIKALQEAMTRIETLEAEVAAMKAQ